MLWFYCAGEEELERIRGEASGPVRSTRAELWASLADAQAACAGALLVVDATRVERGGEAGEGRVAVRGLPREAVLNAVPYYAPRAVVAAGGLIVRSGPEGPDVLMIFRRGAWDLPKGKINAGETIDACALREVKEEVGIRRLEIVRPLGETMHGYVHRGAYVVKTTYWFLMRTPERAFAPQAEEEIEQVEWVPWSEAADRVGYDTLRQFIREHAEGVHSAVR